MQRGQPTFEEYLFGMNHSLKTVKSYSYAVNCFLSVSPNAKNFLYRDVIEYMTQRKQQTRSIKTLAYILAAIKKYYDYLIETGKREDHPCRTFYLKGANRNRAVIHADLFSSTELEMLLNCEERYSLLKLKNQAMTSLLIYQGLASQEIVDLKLQHVNLESGTIFIKESKLHLRRHLEIFPKQYRLLERYINEAREKLRSVETDKFLVGKSGAPITVDDIHYVVCRSKNLFPDRNLTPLTIRQSVIANWLNEKHLPLEQVQLLAGHRWISSTLQYRQADLAEERELINRWHPMG